MVKAKIGERIICKDKIRNLNNFLKELNLIQEACIVLREGNIISLDENLKDDDEIETITFGWEDL